VDDQWRLVYRITSGEYAPPAGKKTKLKFTATITPYPGYSMSECVDDTNPIPTVSLASVGQVIVQQV
jgi:hypothetical protein